MRTGTILSFCFVILAGATGQARAAAQVCGLPSAAGLHTFNDSLAEIAANISGPIADGLAELPLLPAVQGFLAATAANTVCVSALAVSKDIYQYDELLVVISASGGDHPLALPLLFQAASVQAYDNAGPQPWVGIAAQDFTRLLSSAATGAAWVIGPAAGATFSPVDIASQLFPSSAEPDPASLSYVLVPGADPQWTTFLVTRLTVLDTGNPFTSQYLPQAALVQVNPQSGLTRFAPLSGIFDLVWQLEDLQTQAQPAASADPVQALLGLAAQ